MVHPMYGPWYTLWYTRDGGYGTPYVLPGMVVWYTLCTTRVCTPWYIPHYAHPGYTMVHTTLRSCTPLPRGPSVLLARSPGLNLEINNGHEAQGSLYSPKGVRVRGESLRRGFRSSCQ